MHPFGPSRCGDDRCAAYGAVLVERKPPGDERRQGAAGAMRLAWRKARSTKLDDFAIDGENVRCERSRHVTALDENGAGSEPLERDRCVVSLTDRAHGFAEQRLGLGDVHGQDGCHGEQLLAERGDRSRGEETGSPSRGQHRRVDHHGDAGPLVEQASYRDDVRPRAERAHFDGFHALMGENMTYLVFDIACRYGPDANEPGGRLNGDDGHRCAAEDPRRGKRAQISGDSRASARVQTADCEGTRPGCHHVFGLWTASRGRVQRH